MQSPDECAFVQVGASRFSDCGTRDKSKVSCPRMPIYYERNEGSEAESVEQGVGRPTRRTGR